MIAWIVVAAVVVVALVMVARKRREPPPAEDGERREQLKRWHADFMPIARDYGLLPDAPSVDQIRLVLHDGDNGIPFPDSPNVGGYYDPRTRAIHFVESAWARGFVYHELAHAYVSRNHLHPIFSDPRMAV